jgi:hypothetical protein
MYVCPYLTGNTLRLSYEPNRLMLSIMHLETSYHKEGIHVTHENFSSTMSCNAVQ